MNRREFVKCMGAVVGVAAIHGFSFANEGEKKMKCAVVYFSWSGNTRFAAETIAKKTGADIYEIKAETPYSDDFRKILAHALHSAAAVRLEEAHCLALERIFVLCCPCAHGRRHRTPPVGRANKDGIVLREVKSLYGLYRPLLLAVALRLRLVAALVEVAVVWRLGLDLEEVGPSLLRDCLGGETRVSAPREIDYCCIHFLFSFFCQCKARHRRRTRDGQRPFDELSSVHVVFLFVFFLT